MPRKNPLSAKELAICKRLMMHRQKALLSRVALAKLAGIDSSELSRCEHGRAPVRYLLAYKINSSIPLNPAWLATGEGIATAQINLPSPDEMKVEERALFSAVYENELKYGLEMDSKEALEQWKNDMGYLAIAVRADPKGRLTMASILKDRAEQTLARVPDKWVNLFLNDVLNYMEKAAVDYAADEPEKARVLRLAEMARLRPLIERRWAKIKSNDAKALREIKAKKK